MANAPTEHVRCTVTGAEKLPAEVGGAEGVCNAIRAAIGASERAHGASVAVRVLGAYGAAASVTTADGRTLPEQRVSISDRALNQRVFGRLGKALADQLDTVR